MAGTQDTAEQVSEGEMLAQLAQLAASGTRSFVVVGKIKNCRRGKAKVEGEAGPIYGEIICGEGEKISVTLDPKGTVPHGEQNGAFIILPREFQNSIQGFTVTNMVLV